MLRFVAVRLSLILVTLLVVSVTIFAVAEMLPVDAATRILGQYATEANLKYLREELELDRPAPVRYLDWIAGVAQGDFGNSLIQKRPIAEIVGHRLGPSIYLAVFAFLISVPTAVLIGIWAGVRPDSLGDRIASTIGMVGISLPGFVTGLFLVILLSATWRLLPATSTIPRGESPYVRTAILKGLPMRRVIFDT